MRLFTNLPNALTALLLLLTTTDLTQAATKPSNRVLLSDIQTLTLRKDAKTSHRRVSAIPQLICVGGNARGLYEVDVMRCTNSGSGYDVNDIEWTCKAQLPPEFKLGSTEVICEGYDSPDDPYILKGSCGVEYRLVLTDAGEEKYGKKKAWGFTNKDTKSKNTSTSSFNSDDLYTIIFWVIFLGILFFIISAAWRQTRNRPNRPRQPRGAEWGGFGGGGGGGDDGNDPPPPYTPRPPRKSYPSSSRSSQGWRPGFWSGAAGGAAAGYMAGRMGGGNNQNNTAYPQRGGGGWFGGGGNAAAGPSGYHGAPARSSSPDSGPSSSRYESTGFGSTRRR